MWWLSLPAGKSIDMFRASATCLASKPFLIVVVLMPDLPEAQYLTYGLFSPTFEVEIIVRIVLWISVPGPRLGKSDEQPNVRPTTLKRNKTGSTTDMPQQLTEPDQQQTWQNDKQSRINNRHAATTNRTGSTTDMPQQLTEPNQ
jgi:hypothetical protein